MLSYTYVHINMNIHCNTQLVIPSVVTFPGRDLMYIKAISLLHLSFSSHSLTFLIKSSENTVQNVEEVYFKNIV